MTATLFVNPNPVTTMQALWLVIPVCLATSIVYKTIRAKSFHHVPRQVVGLMLYIVGGLVAISLGLWATHAFWP